MVISMEAVVGAAEVAALLGVSRQRVYQLSQRPDWPKGQKLATGWVWSRAEVVAWSKRREAARS